MKKFTALFLTFALLFSFASCREKSVETPSASLTLTESTTISEKTSETVSERVADSSSETITLKQTETKKKISTSNTSSTPSFSLSTVKTSTEKLTEIITTTVRRTRKTTTRRDYSLYTSTTAFTTAQPLPTTEETTSRHTSNTTTEEATSITEIPTTYIYVPAVTTTSVKTCTISISCAEILNNKDKLKEGKESFVPYDGVLLKAVTVEFQNGETAFDILKRACQNNVCADNCQYCQSGGIQLEYEFTPGFDNYYVEGIHQIYEKDCGAKSGWMYKVNGVFPSYGCSDYTVKNGDRIEFVYTCDLGGDIGAEL